MKKEISPKVMIAVIAVVIVTIGLFLFRKASVNDPTPRPDPKYFGISKTGAPAPADPAKP